MSEQATEAENGQQESEQPQEGGEQQEPKTFDADYVANLRREAAKYRTEAKAAASELEKQRQASMSESERAVAEAKDQGRTEATQEFGKRLATADIRTAAAEAGADLAGVFDYLDLSRFVGEDGEPDAKAIKAFVSGLPTKESGPPSFDGGPRSAPPAAKGMNDLLRSAAGRA